VLSYMTV